MAKKEEFIPTDLVKRFYNEGKGETEVITQLRAQGFTPSQIDKALKAVPKHAGPHAPPALPEKHEVYRGPLPKEAMRPTARAEAPAHRPFTPEPLGNEDVGATSEDVNIPDELKPMDMVSHAPKPAPSRKEKEERLPMPAPVSAGIATAPKISLEEMTEAIVNEQEKKLYAHLDRLQADHDANVKKINDVSAKLDAVAAELRVLERAVDGKSSFAGDANKDLAVKIDALETAFKGLAHVLHKK